MEKEEGHQTTVNATCMIASKCVYADSQTVSETWHITQHTKGMSVVFHAILC